MDFEDDDESWMTQAAEAAENDEYLRTTQMLVVNDVARRTNSSTNVTNNVESISSLKQRLTSATLKVSQMESELRRKKEESETHSRLYLAEKRKCAELEKQVAEMRDSHTAEVEMLHAQVAEDWRRLTMREKTAESKVGADDKADSKTNRLVKTERGFADFGREGDPDSRDSFAFAENEVRPSKSDSSASAALGLGGKPVFVESDSMRSHSSTGAEYLDDVVRSALSDLSCFYEQPNAQNAPALDSDRLAEASSRFVSRITSDLINNTAASAADGGLLRLCEMLNALTAAIESILLRGSDSQMQLQLMHINAMCLVHACTALLQRLICSQIRAKYDVQTQVTVANTIARQLEVLRIGLLRFAPSVSSTAGPSLTKSCHRLTLQFVHSGLEIAWKSLSFCATRLPAMNALNIVHRALFGLGRRSEQMDANPNTRTSHTHAPTSSSCCFVCLYCCALRNELLTNDPSSFDDRCTLVRSFLLFVNGLLGLVNNLRIRNVRSLRACRWTSALLKVLLSAQLSLREPECEDESERQRMTMARSTGSQLATLTLRSCVNDESLRKEVTRIHLVAPIDLAHANRNDYTAQNFADACYSLLKQESLGDRLAENALRKFCGARARSGN